MANQLINGTEGAMVPSDPTPQVAADTVPTWGYRGDEAKIFDLKPGESLPDGWADSPAPHAAPDADLPPPVDVCVIDQSAEPIKKPRKVKNE